MRFYMIFIGDSVLPCGCFISTFIDRYRLMNTLFSPGSCFAFHNQLVRSDGELWERYRESEGWAKMNSIHAHVI